MAPSEGVHQARHQLPQGPRQRPAAHSGRRARVATRRMDPAPETQKVAIITGASGGIGAGLVTAFRGIGYAVVGTSRSMPVSDDPDFLALDGDITQADTARRV